MKFAKEFSQDLVPEWRDKYLDYKIGKKKIKAVAKALSKINSQSPQQNSVLHSKTGPRLAPRSWLFDSTTPLWSPQQEDGPGGEVAWDNRNQGGTLGNGASSVHGATTGLSKAAQTLQTIKSAETSPKDQSKGNPEQTPLRTPNANQPLNRTTSATGYGSIISTAATSTGRIGPPSLSLPDPALSVTQTSDAAQNRQVDGPAPPLRRTSTTAGDAYEVGRTHTPSKLGSTLLPKHAGFFGHKRTHSSPHGVNPHRSTFRRMFSGRSIAHPNADVPLESYKDFDVRQADFFSFLDKELDKIETFYTEKEHEAEERLKTLKDQLHIMRDRRVQEIIAAYPQDEGSDESGTNNDQSNGANKRANGGMIKATSAPEWLREIEDAFGVGKHRFGKNSQALSKMALGASGERLDEYLNTYDARKDFSRRPHHDEVTYRSAKRRLKVALQEFYRGLELLKAYALLNRTAFRKINKKYDKAVQARPTLRYMSDRVNKSWFVQSEKLDTLLVGVEDVYARYFERGNHKVAAGKLRSKSKKHSYSGSVFRDGFFLAAGIVFGIEGLVDAVAHLRHPAPIVRMQTSYLLQIYGGYFLSLFLVLLFVGVCRTWVRSKINYKFIFEFDSRHSLDWRQLGEFPSLFLLFLGLCLWLNFQQVGFGPIFIWWPVILVAATVLVLFFPLRTLYYRSRGWFLYAHLRLLLAGIFPVEFRDFFLGDMFCSLTYAMGNIYLFFCLYATGWADPPQCNSSHSRTFGFLTTLPGIWRALQCLRRYHDTRNRFPHLVNFGKYAATCVFYMTLSIYRIEETYTNRVLFIFFATVNSIYVSVWDLVMDWSLCNPWAYYPFLRERLGYKRVWWYYLAMIIDPILRFNWLLYVIVPHELQHSALLSFFVAFSEVCRRGMWTIFRVENEHCTNVGLFRASREPSLPYESAKVTEITEVHTDGTIDLTGDGETPSRDLERQATATSSNVHISPQLRRRRTEPTPNVGTPSSIGLSLNRVGNIIANAHAQDFERKRRPIISSHMDGNEDRADGESSDDDDEDDDREVVRKNREELNEAESILDRQQSFTGSAAGP